MTAAVIGILAALAVGLVVALVLARQQRTATAAALADVRSELEAQSDASLSRAIDTVVRMAREQLGAQSEAGIAQLDSREQLLGQRIEGMDRQLTQVTALVGQLESERARRDGKLSEQLSNAGRQTAELTQVTQALREALASPHARGQWGERMADDVLRTAGFVEGVSYVKQTSTGGGRPDFTFNLPESRVLHMDVKFPLDNYVRMLETDSDTDRATWRKAFLRDVRARIKELATRAYVDPEGGTLDYVLLFIPNEHVYGFVHDADRDLIDHALASRVILCSPLTLFAVLAVVRQSVESFALESTSKEILELLGGFAHEWERFTDAVDKVGRGIETTRRAYDDLNGVRRRQLERKLDRIDDLRTRRCEDATGAALIALPEADHGPGLTGTG